MDKYDLSRITDPQRLETLRSTNLLDTGPEASFDRHARLASRILDVPVALVSLVDIDRQFFKSSVGLPEPWASQRQTPLSHSFCRLVVASGEPFVVKDARLDDLVKDNGAVRDLGVCAYMGVPLIAADGSVLGSFCVIDGKPRAWSERELEILRDLGDSVMTEITLRHEKMIVADINARLNAILDGAVEVAIVGTDLEGRITTFNLGAERLLGYRKEEVVGIATPAWFRAADAISTYEPKPPHASGWDIPSIDDLHPGEARVERELTLVRRDGTSRRFSLSVSSIGDGTGKIVGHVAVGRDVTDARISEENLNKFAALVEHSGDFISMAELDTRVTYVNPAGRKLVGLDDPDEVARTTISDYLDEATLAMAATEAIPSALSSGQWMGKGTLVHFKTGAPIPVEINLFLVRDQITNRPICLATILRDVTENHRTSARILESKARLRAILESSLDALITIDHEGIVVEFNPAAERIFGFKSEEALGRALSDLIIPPIHREPHRQGLKKYLATGKGDVLGQRIEIDALRANGEIFPVELAISVIQLDGPPLFTASLRDISERKKAENDLRRTKEEADAANRSKSDFLANISHEVRTPMAAVLGYADMLLDPGLSLSERDSALQSIRRNGSHLLQLINDILDLSKIEAGKMTFDPIPYSPWQVVLEVVSSLRVRSDERGIMLHAHPIGRMPSTVVIDPTRLRQILMNLVSNAIKFSGERSKIGIRAQASPAGAGWRPSLTFEVEDQGIGMTHEQMDRLFRPFEQVDSSASRRFGGTGLGLSITKRLVETMGGEIKVQSRPGFGSCFTVYLPVTPAPGSTWVEPTSIAGVPGPMEVEAHTPLEGHILLAEDSPDNQRVLIYHLRRLGLKVDVAENGALAVEKAREGGIDLILMDLQMPELDGYGATSSLRRSGFSLPIIALTAHAMKEDREKCLRTGFTDYLTKPVDVNLLASVLGRYLPASPAHVETRPDQWIRSPMADDPGFEPILRIFVDSLESRGRSMREAVTAGDMTPVRTMSHQLKGSGTSYGYPMVTEVAGEIEQACIDGDRGERIYPLLDRFDDFARRIVDGLPPRP